MITGVARLPWPGIEGAFLFLSGRPRREPFSDLTEPLITFTVIDGDCAVEWDGACGPIQLYWKAKEGEPGAKPHWIYDFAVGDGHWSQCAVTDNRLGSAFIDGDFEHIFRVLRQWVRPRPCPDYDEDEVPA